MEGVGALPPACGTTASVEAPAADGNQGGRCDVESNNSNSNHVVCSPCERTSPPMASHRSVSHSETLQIMLRGHKKEHREEECGILSTCSRSLSCCIYKLPITLLEHAVTFLPTDDLCTVLGVSRFFYSSAIAADRTAWKSACLLLWYDKEGFARLAREWPTIERGCQQKELEVISLQQQILKGENLGGVEAAAVDAVKEKWDFDENTKDKHLKEQQLFSVSPRLGYGNKNEALSFAATGYRSESTTTVAEMIVHKPGGSHRQQGELWGASSLRNTPTYEAIQATRLPLALRKSLISPMQGSFLSASSSVSSLSCGETTVSNRELRWWEIKKEDQYRYLSRLVRSLRQQQRRQQQCRDQMSPLLLDGNYSDNSGKTTNSSFYTDLSRSGTSNSPRRQRCGTYISHSYPGNEADSSGGGFSCVSTHLTGGFFGRMETHTSGMQSEALCRTTTESVLEDVLNNDGTEDEEEEEDEEGENDDENLVSKETLKDVFQGFEVKMAMTRALSLQLIHAKRKTYPSATDEQGKKDNGSSSNRGDERNEKTNKWKEKNADYDHHDDEEMYLPVSWKFAYYMSQRDARCERLSMQELMETTWFVCFRSTGSTHSATFTGKGTLIINPVPHTSNSIRGSGDNTTGDQSNAAELPPLTYHLRRGGTELEVNAFPLLKVRRRLGNVAAGNSTNTASSGNNRSSNSEAERAFNAEPDVTLQRLAAEATTTTNTYADGRGVIPVDVEAEGNTRNGDIAVEVAETTTVVGKAGAKSNNDWGWVMENYFVKIFSVDTPLPLYVYRLRRSCAPRPP